MVVIGAGQPRPQPNITRTCVGCLHIFVLLLISRPQVILTNFRSYFRRDIWIYEFKSRECRGISLFFCKEGLTGMNKITGMLEETICLVKKLLFGMKVYIFQKVFLLFNIIKSSQMALACETSQEPKRKTVDLNKKSKCDFKENKTKAKMQADFDQRGCNLDHCKPRKWIFFNSWCLAPCGCIAKFISLSCGSRCFFYSWILSPGSPMGGKIYKFV